MKLALIALDALVIAALIPAIASASSPAGALNRNAPGAHPGNPPALPSRVGTPNPNAPIVVGPAPSHTWKSTVPVTARHCKIPIQRGARTIYVPGICR